MDTNLVNFVGLTKQLLFYEKKLLVVTPENLFNVDLI
jgi:hypothetical protein